MYVGNLHPHTREPVKPHVTHNPSVIVAKALTTKPSTPPPKQNTPTQSFSHTTVTVILQKSVSINCCFVECSREDLIGFVPNEGSSYTNDNLPATVMGCVPKPHSLALNNRSEDSRVSGEQKCFGLRTRTWAASRIVPQNNVPLQAC